MTNSRTKVIRPRRIHPARVWVTIGILLVLLIIPISLVIKSLNFNFVDMTRMFQPAVKKVAMATPAPEAASNTKTRISNPQSYVEALNRTARALSIEINKSPSDPAPQNRLGLIYLTLGDAKSAEQCFINAVNLSRGSISSCAIELEKLKQAGKMADISNVVLEASRISVELSAAHSNLVRVYGQRGDKEAVSSQLEQITRDGLLLSGFSAPDNRTNSKGSNLRAQDAQLLGQAEALFKANQLPAALEDYRKLCESNPKQAFVFDRIGLISVMTGDVSAGIESWEKAAKLDPDSAAIRSNLGLAYHQMGMDKESEQSFRTALALDPSMEEAALNLGEILSARGELVAATKVMQESFRHCPGSARAANNLGTLLSLSGNYAEAMSAFQKAIHIEPGMASAHYGMGVALLKTHKYMLAIRELKIALTLNPAMQDAQAKIEEAHRLAGIRG